MKEYIIRGSLKDHPIRFFIGDTTKTVERMNQIHKTSPVSTSAAGRILTATGLMSFILKNEQDKLSMIVNGDGELGKVIATVDINANVKCDIQNPNVESYLKENGKLNVSRAVGNGILIITYDNGLKEPYSGMIELVTSEIAEDLTNYFLKSEQIPSIVSLGVLVEKDLSVKKAGGFIIQVMPNCGEEIIKYLEERVSQIDSITKLLNDGLSIESILSKIFGEYEFNILERKEIKYHCDCSKDRVEKVLIALGHEELLNLIKSGENTEIKCHFCNTKYLFSVKEIQEIYSAR